MEESPEARGFVRLNVGGTVLVTTVATLRACPGSMLAAMFGESWNPRALARDASGAFYLDADPRFFAPLLNYLRRGELVVEPRDVPGVLAEAKYFGIQPLVQVRHWSVSLFPSSCPFLPLVSLSVSLCLFFSRLSLSFALV